MKTIGQRLIFLRENLDMTQVHLAKRIGITKMTLYKYEKDLTEPRGEIIARMADALDTTADFLVGRTNSYEPYSFNKKQETVRKDENSLLIKYRRLNAENKIKIGERMDVLLESQD